MTRTPPCPSRRQIHEPRVCSHSPKNAWFHSMGIFYTWAKTTQTSYSGFLWWLYRIIYEINVFCTNWLSLGHNSWKLRQVDAILEVWGFFIKDDWLNWSPVNRLQKCHKKKKDKFKIQRVKTREKKLKVVLKKRRRPGFSEHTGLFKYSQRSVNPSESQGAGTLSQGEREKMN